MARIRESQFNCMVVLLTIGCSFSGYAAYRLAREDHWFISALFAALAFWSGLADFWLLATAEDVSAREK